MNLVRVGLVIALIAGTAGHSIAIETRARVSKGLRYDDFTYSGRHWLEGVAVAISQDTLILRMNSGSYGRLSIPIDTITELQIREASEEWPSEWEQITWPQPIDAIREQIGLPSATLTPDSDALQSSQSWLPQIAYIEEDGTEVLILRESMPALINSTVRERLGLFRNIKNFESAEYLRLPDGSYAVRLATYDESGVIHTAVRAVSATALAEISNQDASTASQATRAKRQAPRLPNTAPGQDQRTVTRPITQDRQATLVYGGGGYHIVPSSAFLEEIEDLGLELSGANTNAGSVGAMLPSGSRRFIDIAIATYGTRDRIVTMGQVLEADFTVKSIEAAMHRSLVSQSITLTVFTGFGVAIVNDKRQFGSVVDIQDEITAWPYSIGLRLITSDRRRSGVTGYLDARLRMLALEYKSSGTTGSKDLQLGGFFLQMGLAYRL